MIDNKQFTYQSRLLYENVLSEALKRCLKERIDNPNTLYPRAVKAFSMAMPKAIKKEYIKKQFEHDNIMQSEISDDKLEFLLEKMEGYGLLIPTQIVKHGGGYR